MKVLHVGCCAVGEPYAGIQSELAKLGEYREIHSGTSNIDDAVLNVIKDYTPDLVFLQLQYTDFVKNKLSNYVIDIMRKKGAWVCNWTGDIRYPIPKWYYETGRHVNITLFSNMHDVRIFWKAGLPSDYLQIGFDPLVYNPVGEVKESADIVFMANNYKGREDLNFPLSDYRWDVAHALKKEFGNRFALYGNGWPEELVSGSLNADQKLECAHYRGAKIAINISHYEYERYSSDRLLRILGSGTACLSHWFPYIESDFYVRGQQLSVFHNIPELIKKCHYYLNHPDDRTLMAWNGSVRAHESFLYKNMVENLVEIYNKTK